MTLIRSISDPNPAADFNRGLACPDAGSAFPHLLRAAETGCVRAEFLVGLAYHTGRGVAVDFERAAAWYRRAAADGDSPAIANLGVMSLLGQGAAVNEIDAYTWIQSAVGLGHTWLAPALEALDRRLSGHDDPIPESLSPATPVFEPCTLPRCDHCRCRNAA